MRVIVITDGIGQIGAVAAAQTAQEGWEEAAEDELDLVPVSAGGPGFLQALQANLPGDLTVHSVTGPRGGEVPATVFVTEMAGSRTAYIEAAEACGLHLLTSAQRDPERTTTRGVAELLEAAVATGAERIVVGVGGSATNDAGAGMLAALGVGSGELLDRGPGALAEIRAADLNFGPARELLARVDLIVASTTQAPLLGFSGASGKYAQTKGASREQAQEMERALAHFADACAEATADLPTENPGILLTPGQPQSRIDVEQLRSLPGSGAGGGLGFALGLLGARILPGSEVMAAAINVTERAAQGDLIFVITDGLDATTLGDGPIEIGVAAGSANALATIALARRAEAGNRELATAGISAAYELVDSVSRPGAGDDLESLRDRVRRIARSWTR